jgi:tryptophanyl-tRNA synthetase
MQDEYDCFYFVADLHALTTEYENTQKIKNDTIEMVADWLAIGLDPSKVTMFVQSQIPEHAELHVFLSMITPLPWLERCPTYKEQLRELKARDLYTYGFLGYPVLQSADILMYKANKVPVGEDQLPHLELTREIARRFNSLYGEVFVEPQALLTHTPRLPGSDGRKMSKSYNNCIYLSDTPDAIRKKISSYITDPARKHPTDPGHPDVCSVHELEKIYLPESGELGQLCTEGKIGCVKCKKLLAEAIIKSLEPIHLRQKEIRATPGLVDKVLAEGSCRAKIAASAMIAEVKKALKLWNTA